MEPSLTDSGAAHTADAAQPAPAAQTADAEQPTHAEQPIPAERAAHGQPAPPAELRRPPQPPRRGPLKLLRFMAANNMLNRHYLRLLARLAYLKLRHRGRLQTEGMCFICPGVTLELGANASLKIGRFAWIGHGCKIRVHEGEVCIGAKTVMGQECTISAYQHVHIGRECIIADRVMLIDFDHGVVEVERPIRLQGIYKRDVDVGHNVWIGYGACVLRGVKVGDNSIVGTSSVVTRDVPENAVVGGVPARLIRMREAPQRMRWE